MSRRNRALVAAGLLLAGCSPEAAPQPAMTTQAAIERAAAADRAEAAERAKAPAGPATFRPYTAPDGRFRVNFPGEPLVAHRPGSPPDRAIGTDTYLVDAPPRRYAVAITRRPDRLDPAPELSKLVEADLEAGADARLITAEDVTVRGLPGRRVLVQLGGNAHRHALHLVGEREVIRASCDLPRTEEDDRNGRSFVDSFDLLQ